jgi:hypothetical protein
MLSYALSTGGLLGAGSAGLWVGAFAWTVAVFGLVRGAHAVTRPRLLGVDIRRGGEAGDRGQAGRTARMTESTTSTS